MSAVVGLVEDVERARSALLDLLTRIEPDELAVPIGEGRWSPTQYVEHLVRAEEVTVWRMVKAVEDARRRDEVLVSPTPRATIEEIAERTWGDRVEAPPLAVPQLGEPGSYWRMRLERNAALVAELADLVREGELDALAYPHPISGPLTLRQGFQFLRFHLDRHRGHLEEAGLGRATGPGGPADSHGLV